MSGLKDRLDGFEKKFVHDEALKFKAAARRNKLLGLWAAERLGIIGHEAGEYAKEVIIADFDEVGDEDVFRKIRSDLDDSVSDKAIRDIMDRLMATAIDQVQSE